MIAGEAKVFEVVVKGSDDVVEGFQPATEPGFDESQGVNFGHQLLRLCGGKGGSGERFVTLIGESENGANEEGARERSGSPGVFGHLVDVGEEELLLVFGELVEDIANAIDLVPELADETIGPHVTGGELSLHGPDLAKGRLVPGVSGRLCSAKVLRSCGSLGCVGGGIGPGFAEEHESDLRKYVAHRTWAGAWSGTVAREYRCARGDIQGSAQQACTSGDM